MFGTLRLWTIIAAVGTSVAAFAAYTYMQREAGAESERQKQINATFDQLKKRNEINEATDQMPLAELCDWAGGVFKDNKCEER